MCSALEATGDAGRVGPTALGLVEREEQCRASRSATATATAFTLVTFRAAQMSNVGHRGIFDMVVSEHMADLRGCLVVGWRSLLTWWMRVRTAARDPLCLVADGAPVRRWHLLDHRHRDGRHYAGAAYSEENIPHR